MDCTTRIGGWRERRLLDGLRRRAPFWRRWIASGSLVVMAPFAGAADAQVADSLKTLLRSGALRSGDGVYITNAGGRRAQADIVDLTSTTVTLEDGERTWTLVETQIRKIERQDSLRNGVATGLLAGVATAYAACKMQRHSDQCVYGVVYIGYPAIAIGSVAGAIIDANRRETIYQRREARRMTLLPLVPTGGVGARLSVCW